MNARPCLLLVDDERAIRESLAERFRQAGYDVLPVASGPESIRIFSDRRPDLVLLDVMMPAMNGYDVCREMRKLDRETPIVFLSALDAEEDQILGLDVGADDYVSKLASDALLFARLKKALERADRFSSLVAPVEMTKTEADIFRLLEAERGRYFSYREIFAAVCGEGYAADEGAIRVHISHMRKKLPRGLSLVSRRRIGYALISLATL